jgi:hypothetical protein
MKITLKNLKVNLTFSQETTMFQADVYVDGVKTAYAQNDGHGGCTGYHAYEGKRDLLKKAEEFAASLPSKTYSTLTLKSNLEMVIDDLVDAHVREKENLKFNRKIEKLTKNHIVWGIPNGDSYHKICFKGRPDFEKIIKLPQGKIALENLVKKVKSELKPNEVIFNKNL